MFSPSPISLICAILLCLPLAIVLTITTPLTTTTTTSGGSTPFTTTNHNSTLQSTRKKEDPKNERWTSLDEKRGFPGSGVESRLMNLQTQDSKSKTAATLPSSSENDDSLFRRAALVNSSALRVGPLKVAFMFLTTSPLPFAPLWELYFNNTPRKLYNIYIHADPTSHYHPPFTGVFSNRVIPSEPTRRYSPTLAAAARRLLAQALLHDPANYMFALLSPSCIPLRSFEFTYKVLTRSKKSFIEILKNEVHAAERWAARGPQAMLPEVSFEDFRIGSQFFAVTRKHARVVVRDRRVWSKLKLPCLERHTCYPEEHYFATLMSMVDPRGCVPCTLTHVEWRGSHDGHPRTYRASEVGPDLIKALRKDRPRYGDNGMNGSNSSVRERDDPFLFGRKFSVDSVETLLNIANDVIFKD
ncbi:hypothetical protein LguiA_036494 [Lonicera macranthoides]